MLISDSEGWIFIHNPKCAGSTVRRALMKRETRNNSYWMFQELEGCEIDRAHMPMHIFRLVAPSDFELLDKYRVFGFCRNPYTRAISAYNETHQGILERFRKNEVPLGEYSNKVNEFISQLSKRAVSGWQKKFRHFVPQYDMFYHNGKCKADVIGRIEDVEVDRKKFLILGSVGEELYKVLERKENEKSTGVSWRDILDESSVRVINQVYDKDFKAFGYEEF